MPGAVFESYANDFIEFNQYKYPYQLYKSEMRLHDVSIDEYSDCIVETMRAASEAARPNMKLYSNQPYLKPVVRYRLVDFVMKMSVRLKLIPFVFCRAVRLFDRYCSKRVVLLDQAQLVIATCLWIAAKINGGNNHFANMHGGRNDPSVRSILDLGYGSGARFKGPTERYRMPKVKELVKLCGSRCGYTASMFNQMEIHIMDVLDWKLSEPSIDEYMVHSHELKVTADVDEENQVFEFFLIKRFMAYAACYSYDLVKYDSLQVAKVMVDVINDTFQLQENDIRFQSLNHCVITHPEVFDYTNYYEIRRHLVRAIVRISPYLLEYFDTQGPQSLHWLLSTSMRQSSLDTYRPPASFSSGSSVTSVFSDSPSSPLFSNSTGGSPSTENSECEQPMIPLAEGFHKVGFETKPSEDFVARWDRRNCGGYRTPTSESFKSCANPPASLFLPGCLLYTRSNDSQLSLRSNASSKETEIFDMERPRCGVGTPASGDEAVMSKSIR